jgi:hypothetical protein
MAGDWRLHSCGSLVVSEHLLALTGLIVGSVALGVGIVAAIVGWMQLTLMLEDRGRRREVAISVSLGQGENEALERGIKRRRRRARGRRR